MNAWRLSNLEVGGSSPPTGTFPLSKSKKARSFLNSLLPLLLMRGLKRLITLTGMITALSLTPAGEDPLRAFTPTPHAERVTGLTLAGRILQGEHAVILIPGGVEDEAKARAARTLEEILRAHTQEDVPIIVSGATCGLHHTTPEEREADRLAAYLHGLPVIKEREARNTLGNITLSYPSIREAIGEKGIVLIITHEQHASRAYTLAKRVLPDTYEIGILTVPHEHTLLDDIAEKTAYAVTLFETRHCAPHDPECYLTYIREEDSYYCGVYPENACQPSLYERFAHVYQTLKQGFARLTRLLSPTQSF